MTYDDIGKPGAEFYPFVPPPVPGFSSNIASEEKPHGFDDMAYGGRLSWLKDGWDVSGFYYSTIDPVAAFSRQAALQPAQTITYRPIHERIHQFGATLSKDLGPMVLRAEAVYTKDRQFITTSATDADGLVKQNVLDSIVGLEWNFPKETLLDVQLFQRWFTDHDAGIVPDTTENGASFMISTEALHPGLEAKVLVVSSLNRNDGYAQFKLTWKMDGNWQLATGVDAFHGPSYGLFGEYDEKDRVYTEVRYTF
jgi:hypothetical protein